jgi:crotonobetainyl-CoA:carnitine CoA-transferase CaiB-like acyl-CoA transferase
VSADRAGQDRRDGPLAGLRVLDFSHLLAGPFCTMLMADNGADVVKVEPPWGDGSRQRGPTRTGPDGHKITSFLAATNRGKRSMVIDLRTEEGKQLIHSMLPKIDVLVENFLPGVIDRMGFPLEELRKQYPQLITVSISLFGGDHAKTQPNRPGLAIAAEGESGVADLCRNPDGSPKSFGFPLGDFCAGMSAYAAVTTALLKRALGRGNSAVDISMVRALFAFNGVAGAGMAIDPEYGAPTTAPYGYFPSADGHVAIGVNLDPLWQRFVAVIDRMDLADDPRYRDHGQRDVRVAEVGEIVSAWTSRRPGAEIVRLLAKAGVPCGRVNSALDVITEADPATGLVTEVEDGLGGTVRVAANPFGVLTPGKAIPRLGQHTAEVIGEWAALDSSAVADLFERGVVGASGGPQERATPKTDAVSGGA